MHLIKKNFLSLLFTLPCIASQPAAKPLAVGMARISSAGLSAIAIELTPPTVDQKQKAEEPAAVAASPTTNKVVLYTDAEKRKKKQTLTSQHAELPLRVKTLLVQHKKSIPLPLGKLLAQNQMLLAQIDKLSKENSEFLQQQAKLLAQCKEYETAPDLQAARATIHELNAALKDQQEEFDSLLKTNHSTTHLYANLKAHYDTFRQSFWSLCCLSCTCAEMPSSRDVDRETHQRENSYAHSESQ